MQVFFLAYKSIHSLTLENYMYPPVNCQVESQLVPAVSDVTQVISPMTWYKPEWLGSCAGVQPLIAFFITIRTINIKKCISNNI